MHQLEERSSSQSQRSAKIGYIGGGSRGWAHTLINDLLQCDDLVGTVSLYDVEYEAAEQNAELANGLVDRPEATGDWSFEACRDIDEALDGADFVICSIQDPIEETFVHDIDVPQEYGIYQPVADTVGPGGVLRSMRAIPQYREIAATVRERCPDAWVINYTNPMTVCTRALYEEYPDINAIGLCHEVFAIQRMLADVAETYVDEADDVAGEEINVNVKGINHFTWIDDVHWNGHDVFQYLEQELEERKPIPSFEPGDFEDESYWTNHHEVAFDLYDRFGVLGAAGDRHLAEFVPWYLDIDDPEEIQRWGFRLTPSSARTTDTEGPAKMEQYLSGDEAFEFTESGEEVVDIMRALVGLEPIKTHVNYPNRGQTPDLPTGAVVETNAMITGSGVAPITAGELPREVRSMVLRAIHNQETLIEAGFAGDLDLAFQAFLNDALVTIGREEARDLFVELVDLEREYLQAYDLADADVLER
ncbi:glycoside hydrolase family 4 (plasmid) [Halostagnicola larsenii XH-48]|uniref:Glycoside hydrolase family 4 n=1 Tax=Halostagnicola larsenii XH-48 TaxID=797299 RepID=W0JVV5_9EURY|nr:glycoside hydrolase family 4 [Halostagnicola larsenii]AHG01365.1 glycoside hydrolase family 4 [Halostagnicola larsenii XH-48]